MNSLRSPLCGILVWCDSWTTSTRCVLMRASDLRDIVDDVEVVVYCLMTRIALCLGRSLNKDAWDACLLLVVVGLKNFSVGR